MDISSAAAPPERRTGRRWRRIWALTRPVVLPLAVVLVLGLAWEGAVRAFAIPEFLLPAPSQIWKETVAIGGVVAGHTLATLHTTMLGFLVSVAVSLPLAVAITASPLIANAIYPLLVVTQSIPKVALAPILVVVFGASETSRVLVTFLVAFFPLVISIATGLLAVPPELIELGRSLKASRLQELFRIRLPYAVPFVFSGLKLSITFSVIGAVVGEFVAAERGLGYQILSATAFFRTPLAFGAVIILSALGIILFQAVVLVERIFFPWSVQEDASRR
ncbi:MAG: ABC transporter permease [Alphaproteobacteria bacterium]